MRRLAMNLINRFVFGFLRPWTVVGQVQSAAVGPTAFGLRPSVATGSHQWIPSVQLLSLVIGRSWASNGLCLAALGWLPGN